VLTRRVRVAVAVLRTACHRRRAKISHITAGLAHSVVTTRSGRVFSFGWGEFGQLGLGNDADAMLPKQVHALADVKVVSTAAGAQHTVFFTRVGEVFSCGKATRGRLGHADKRRRFTPEQFAVMRRDCVDVLTGAGAGADAVDEAAEPRGDMAPALHRWLAALPTAGDRNPVMM
jgi:alpha-tubulin suppressor-like RCC1 family protein